MTAPGDFDYIVIGAGSAGCVVASRLSEDPAIRVLLIEAGGSDRTPVITMPGALPFAYQSARLGWGYQSGPEPELDGRTLDEKRGRVIGGSSSINAMICNRGNPADFDNWAAMGLPGWGYADCLPYFRAMETFSGGADAWRGGSGPMHVRRCAAAHPLHTTFLRGGEQAGFPIARDHNGAAQEGLHIAQAFIHQGRRWSTARGYLDPAAGRPNLVIWPHTTVQRLEIEGGAARGVVVRRAGTPATLRCHREIILAAGAFNTPQVLMLSGIGPADALRALDIPVTADLPGVGRNLENHPGINLQYATRREDSLVSQLGPFGQVRLAAEWALFRRGLGATNFFETGAFLRTHPDVPYPNIQFEFLPLVRTVRAGRLIAIPGFQFWLDLSRPLSRGAVTLRSADPGAAPRIVFNHLQHRQDVADLIAGVRLGRTLVAQPAWDGIRGAEISPGADATSDADLERILRAQVGTSYHPSGTCRMGYGRDDVVDAQGRVHGIAGLRIADASIMPRIVTANLSAAIMMMAERIAAAIAGTSMSPSAVRPA